MQAALTLSCASVRPTNYFTESISHYLSARRDGSIFGAAVKLKEGKRVSDRVLVIGKFRVYIFKPNGKVQPDFCYPKFTVAFSVYKSPKLSLITNCK